MKRAALPLIAILFTLPGLAQADSAYGSLQSVHEKNTVLKDLRKICTPQGSPSDDVWEKTIMSDTRNQQHIREGFLYALQQDCDIPEHIWNATFTKAAFIDFLMEHMMNDLSHQRRSCTFTKELICRLLQVTHGTTTHGTK